MAKYLYENKFTIDKNGKKVILDELDYTKPLGLTFDENDISKVDTLSYIPLKDKVMAILTGQADFSSSKDEDLDYDEQETEVYGGDEEDLDFAPIDEYSDKIDIVEQSTDIKEKLKSYQNKVEATRVEAMLDDDKSTVTNNDTVDSKDENK